MTIDDLIQLSSKLGSLPLLTMVIVVIVVVSALFYYRVIVPGPYYFALEAKLTKVEQQRDEALELAAKLTDILEAGRRGSYRGR